MKKNQGFSLIELAIALTIVGFIAGGVVAGKSMMKNSQILAMIKELDVYSKATAQFQKTYGMWPGDFPSASEIWQGAGNGNGDGRIEGASGTYPETIFFWNHLSRAGLIGGTYSGIPGYPRPGIQIPGTAYQHNGGYLVWWQDNNSDFGEPSSRGNYLGLGGNQNSSSDHNGEGFLIPQDAYTIDSKIDDGLPVSGRFIAKKGNSAPSEECRTGNYPSGVYKMQTTSYACRGFFLLMTQ